MRIGDSVRKLVSAIGLIPFTDRVYVLKKCRRGELLERNIEIPCSGGPAAMRISMQDRT